MGLTTGFQLPFGIQPLNPVPTDSWSGPYEGVDAASAIAAANAAIPSGVRFKSMEVRLIVSGVPKKYWYASGTTNSDLVEFFPFDVANTRYLALSGGVISANSSTDALRITQEGSGNALVVEDSTNPDSTPFVITSIGRVGIGISTPNEMLTVVGSISATDKIYGTVVDWMTLVRGYKTTPTLLESLAGGDVYSYTYATTGSDITYYRYIANNESEDSFYKNFSGGVLSNLLAKKQITL